MTRIETYLRYQDVFGTLPLVVAVQVIHDFAIKKIDAMDGLLGEEAISLDCNRRPRLPKASWPCRCVESQAIHAGSCRWPGETPYRSGSG
jgi:hypothetical protein